MRRDLASVAVAVSAAVLVFAAGHAHAQGARTYVLLSPVVQVSPEATGGAQVLCNGSDFATGGGLVSSVGRTGEKLAVSDSFPISDTSGAPTPPNAGPNGWRIIAFNPTLDFLQLQAYVVCTSASPLSVNAAGTGGGTVSSSDGLISCPGTCAAIYNRGASVTLTATPAAGSIFSGWNGCDTVDAMTCTVTMSAARSVTATFD
jgi:hypothetical protein